MIKKKCFRLVLLTSTALFLVAAIPQKAQPAVGQTGGPLVTVGSVAEATVYVSGKSVILTLPGQTQFVLSADDARTLANDLEQAATVADSQ